MPLEVEFPGIRERLTQVQDLLRQVDDTEMYLAVEEIQDTVKDIVEYLTGRAPVSSFVEIAADAIIESALDDARDTAPK